MQRYIVQALDRHNISLWTGRLIRQGTISAVDSTGFSTLIEWTQDDDDYGAAGVISVSRINRCRKLIVEINAVKTENDFTFYNDRRTL